MAEVNAVPKYTSIASVVLREDGSADVNFADGTSAYISPDRVADLKVSLLERAQAYASANPLKVQALVAAIFGALPPGLTAAVKAYL